MSAARKQVDWEAVERDYRAGIKTLRQMADEHGVSHVAITKHATKNGWSRDLQAKIKAKAEEKVTKAQVTSLVTVETKLRDQQIVEANAEIVAQADLANRKDVLAALEVSRSQLAEVAALCDPQFREKLEWLGKVSDQSCVTDTGREVKDRANELYQYIISLAGRVKMSKEIAASHAAYIPMQRKMLKLDTDADKSQSAVDELLAKINAAN